MKTEIKLKKKYFQTQKIFVLIFAVFLLLPVNIYAADSGIQKENIFQKYLINPISQIFLPWFSPRENTNTVIIKTENVSTSSPQEAEASAKTPLIINYSGVSREEVSRMITGAISGLPTPIQNYYPSTYITGGGSSGSTQGVADALGRTSATLQTNIDNLSTSVSSILTAPSITGEASFASSLLLSQISAPSDTSNRIYNTGGNLYWAGNLIGGASTGNWTSDGTSVWRAGGNVSFLYSSSTVYSSFATASTTNLIINGQSFNNLLGSGLQNTGGVLTLDTSAINTYIHASSTIPKLYTNNIFAGANTFNGTLTLGSMAINSILSTNASGVITATSTPTFGNFNATSTTATSTLSTGGFAIGGSQFVVQQNSGYVGIGTADPTAPLTIKSPTPLKITNTDDSEMLSLTVLPACNGVCSPSTVQENIGLGAGGLNTTTVTTALGNIGIGRGPLHALTSGLYSNFIGLYAGQNFQSGNGDNAFGTDALAFVTSGNDNQAFGHGALNAVTTGSDNIGIGVSSGHLISTTNQNIGIGSNSNLVFTGTGQTAIGYNALQANTTSAGNTAVGWTAGIRTTSVQNTFVGYAAGQGTGAYSTAVGYGAMGSNSSGAFNSAFGTSALGSLTNGAENTGLGEGSLSNVTSGGNNTGLGTIAGATLTTGSQNTFVGESADVSVNNLTNTTALGYQAVALASNQMMFGNASVTTNIFHGNVGIGTTTPWKALSVNGGVAMPALPNDSTGYYVCLNTTTGQLATSTGICGASSIKYKENIADISYGLNEVLKLKPVSFDYKNGYIKNAGRQIGFIAEEVAPVIPEVVSRDSSGEIQCLDYPKFTAVLAKAIQELNKKFDDIMTTLTETFDKYLASHEVYIRDANVGSLNVQRNTNFGGDINVEGKVCVDDTCLTKEQFKEMMLRSGVGAIQVVSGGNSENNNQSNASSTDNTSTTTPEISTSTPSTQEQNTASTTPVFDDTSQSNSATSTDSIEEEN